MAPPPPPPPPPLCLPFSRGKSRRRLTFTEQSARESYGSQRSSINRLERANSFSPTATLTSHAGEKISFDDSSQHEYDAARSRPDEAIEVMIPRQDVRQGVLRRNTTRGRIQAPPPPPVTPQRKRTLFGYGWGSGKREKEKQRELAMMEEKTEEREDSLDLTRNESYDSRPPLYQSPRPSNGTVHSPRPSNGSARPPRMSNDSGRESVTKYLNPLPPQTPPTNTRSNTYKSNVTHTTMRSGGSGGTRNGGSGSGGAGGSAQRRPRFVAAESMDTLVGSAYERKVNDLDAIPERADTKDRLDALRALMAKENIAYYIIPSEDAHGSEYVAINDKRREWISGFTGSSGQAIISDNNAYLVTDSRYWVQARQQLDSNWVLIKAGAHDGPKDWAEWLLDRARDARIGIDARMISYEKAASLKSILNQRGSKLVYPTQNLVDLIWAERPARSKEPVYVQGFELSGMHATAKLADLREWIRQQPASSLPFSPKETKPSQMQVATLISSLPNIAWLLNLRGDDIPFNPVFHSYLFVSLSQAVLFIEPAKVSPAVDEYLQSIGVERREYNEIWSFLRLKPWGEGKVVITPETSYAIALILTSMRYTVLASYVDQAKAIKNDVELNGLRNAYLRDGIAFVRFLAWLEQKIQQGFEITEYEAAWRLTEYRRQLEKYQGLAYENISASGPNAALPHYSPRKATARFIDQESPYMNDSGGQYSDGTCDTTRTVHFGRPTDAQCEAFTRVLQGHIAIDSAVFPEGTSGLQLDVLARKALWKDGLNYMHGTGHGVGSFLTVHEGPQGFSSSVPLVPGHVVTNEPGFYKEGQFGVRIESCLAVKRGKTKHQFNGNIWLSFERLTCVPIQTKMVRVSMLTREEKEWLRAHNKRCYDRLAPYLEHDQRALKWLRREANKDIGLAAPGPAGISIDWD